MDSSKCIGYDKKSIDFIKQLNKILKIKGISLYKLCILSDINPTSVSNWQSKRHIIPNAVKLYNISKVLGCTMEELLVDDPSLKSVEEDENYTLYQKILIMPDKDRELVADFVDRLAKAEAREKARKNKKPIPKD